jgi:photosystem II cytochrome c550
MKINKEYRIQKSLLFSIAIVINFFIFKNSVSAIELNETVRTIKLNSEGQSIILTPEQIKRGKRLFNSSCSSCHAGGITKTNPNVGLDTESLSLATPPRNNANNLIDYMKDPTTYDGIESIAETHPSIKSADIFSKMRSFSDEDLFAIAGHILVQPNIVSEKWGGGKIYY